MKREEVCKKLSQTVGVTKAEEIVSEAESALGYTEVERYTHLEIRSLCEQIKQRNEGYIKEVANQLRVRTQANHRFQTLLENVPNPTVVIEFEDREPIIRSVNEPFEQAFKFDAKTAVGESLIDLVVPDDEQLPFEVWSRTNGQRKQEVSRRTGDNEQRTFLVRRAIATRGNGGVEGYAVYTDITDRKRREQELRMLKEVFSRVFRHNVRNELTLLRGQLEIIEAGTDTSEITERATTAKGATDRLLDHAEKARQIERIVDMDPSVIEQSLHTLVVSVVKQCQHEHDGLMINTNVDDVPVQVIEGFEIAIENAVHNAVEHNSSSIEIDLTTDIGPETATLKITDNGSGIPSSEISVLEEERETPLSHGSGVGLWLMKWYVDRSGGTLDITQTETGTRIAMILNRPS